ncbi:MAG: class I SAM-dependent methyltransferase [Methylocystis sp.]
MVPVSLTTQRTPAAERQFEPSNVMFRVARGVLGSPDGRVLDMGCGYGRNAIALAKLGHHVVAVDNDFERLKFLMHEKDVGRRAQKGSITCIKADLSSANWPFAENSFTGIASVHFTKYQPIRFVHRFLQENGWLYFDSVGAQGKNYLQLPERGWMKNVLQDHFRFEHYEERHAGPRGENAVAIRLLAKRI